MRSPQSWPVRDRTFLGSRHWTKAVSLPLPAFGRSLLVGYGFERSLFIE
ncbi:hypothetical protein [Dendronalium sp. ChiSLP03b]